MAADCGHRAGDELARRRSPALADQKPISEALVANGKLPRPGRARRDLAEREWSSRFRRVERAVGVASPAPIAVRRSPRARAGRTAKTRLPKHHGLARARTAGDIDVVALGDSAGVFRARKRGRSRAGSGQHHSTVSERARGGLVRARMTKQAAFFERTREGRLRSAEPPGHPLTWTGWTSAAFRSNRASRTTVRRPLRAASR